MPDSEIITRRNLPHWYVPGAPHFVTFRLAESLPHTVLDRLREERSLLLRPFGSGIIPPPVREKIHKVCFGRFDRELDQGKGPTYLRQPNVAAIVRQSLYFLHDKQYHLLAYCILPNHVHVLFQPMDSLVVASVESSPGEETSDGISPLAQIMHSLKSFTAHRINELLGRSGTFWQSESYDPWVRDDDELERIVHYIALNPVKANLVRAVQEWYFCSAHDRLLHDGSEHAWLDLSPQHRRDACATTDAH